MTIEHIYWRPMSRMTTSTSTIQHCALWFVVIRIVRNPGTMTLDLTLYWSWRLMSRMSFTTGELFFCFKECQKALGFYDLIICHTPILYGVLVSVRWWFASRPNSFLISNASQLRYILNEENLSAHWRDLTMTSNMMERSSGRKVMLI
jgi:hypothetical protein